MKDKASDIVGRIFLCGFIGFVGFWVWAIIELCTYSLVTMRQQVYIVRAMCILPIICIFVLVLNKKIAKKLWKPLLVGEGICVLLFIGMSCYTSYLDSVPSVGEYFSLYSYEPYSGEKVATLDEPSVLQLEEDLPLIDCATALYPVLGSFAQAVYPQGEYPYRAPYGSDEIVQVGCTGTYGAYNRLIDGKVDIILVAAPSQAQREQAAQAQVELILTPIGQEAFVFFVNSKNPVTELTVEQIQEIYTGETKNWKKLGGENAKIKAYQRSEGSGSQTALQQLMQGKDLVKPPTREVADAMDGIIERVASYSNFENAIGFSFRFYSTEMVQTDEIRLLDINGVPPTTDTIRDGTYPITSHFYAVTTNQTNNPNVEAFIAWMQSQQGQALVEKVGYVGLE